MQRLKDFAYESFGEVAFLMNNAGVEGGGTLFGDPARWRKILDVNLWGVIYGVQIFAPAMIAQGDALRHRQYRIETGHHLPAGRNRLQCDQSGRESRHRSSRP